MKYLRSGLFLSACFLVVFNINSIANAASEDQTEINAKKVLPNNDDLKKAISELYGAINTKNEGHKLEYINKAKKLLEIKTEGLVIPAALYCGKEKMFAELDWCSTDILETLCYQGELSGAIQLLEIGADRENFGSDEEWLEEPRLGDKGELLIDFVDGPNEYREVWTIDRCSK